MSVWALLMAAGSGERMGLGRNKVLADLCGKPVLLRSAEAFETAVDGMVVVVQPRDEAEARALLPAALRADPVNIEDLFILLAREEGCACDASADCC